MPCCALRAVVTAVVHLAVAAVVQNRFGIYPLVEGPGRHVHPKTTTFCLVLGFTTSGRPSRAHQSQNDLEQDPPAVGAEPSGTFVVLFLFCLPLSQSLVAHSSGLFGTSRPVFPLSVFLTCNVGMKIGIPCTFSSGRVTSGNCQPALQAPLWHFSVFLTCNVGMKNGLSRTFSSGRTTSGNPRPSFRVFWGASQSLFAASGFPDVSHQDEKRPLMHF